MQKLVPLVLRSWSLPFVVLALVAPSVAAFSLVGPQLGLAVGALTVAAVIVLAARARFDEEIEVAAATDRRYRLLVVTPGPLDDPELVQRIAAIASEGESVFGGGPAELRVVVPARSSRLDRWATDLEPARAAAGRALAVTLGALGVAGLDAGGRIGDGDVIQAIEDELRRFSAREVVLVDGPGLGLGEVEEVRRRLDRPVRGLAQATASSRRA